MKREEINILIFLIILTVIVLIIRWLLSRNCPKESHCKGDEDCETGVCHNGECVQCAFDSDCCASSTCQNGKCVPNDTPQVDCGTGPTFNQACQNINFDQFTVPQIQTFDLKPTIVEGDHPIDWSTLTFTNIEVYTRDDTATSPLFANCQVDDLSQLPYGTHDGGTVNPGTEFCGLPTENPAGTFTWTLCDNGTQNQTGETDTAVVSHDSNGVISVDISTTSANSFSGGLFWKFSYNVETLSGCSYDSIAYFAMALQL